MVGTTRFPAGDLREPPDLDDDPIDIERFGGVAGDDLARVREGTWQRRPRR